MRIHENKPGVDEKGCPTRGSAPNFISDSSRVGAEPGKRYKSTLLKGLEHKAGPILREYWEIKNSFAESHTISVVASCSFCWSQGVKKCRPAFVLQDRQKCNVNVWISPEDNYPITVQRILL